MADGKGGTAQQTITVTVIGANDVLFHRQWRDGRPEGTGLLRSAQDDNFLNAKDGDDVVYLPNAGNALAGEYGVGKVFNAGGGDDFVYGGDLNDAIHGEDGNDTLIGGSGNDTLTGGKRVRHDAWRSGRPQTFGQWGHVGALGVRCLARFYFDNLL